MNLLFTDNDLHDCESALMHYQKVGERSRPTRIEKGHWVGAGPGTTASGLFYNLRFAFGPTTSTWNPATAESLSPEFFALPLRNPGLRQLRMAHSLVEQ